MSDFLYTAKRQPAGVLADHLNRAAISNQGSSLLEYHGPWGSLATSANLYPGFNPVETDAHLIVVIGGPLLRLSAAGTPDGRAVANGKSAAVLEAWRKNNGNLSWDTSLSGPFFVVIVDKSHRTVHLVSDVLGFIPAFWSRTGELEPVFVAGTHLDCVARVAGHGRQVDHTSVVDFVLDGKVTPPYTLFEDVFQVKPGSVMTCSAEGDCPTEEHYWLPAEESRFGTIHEAAAVVREALVGHIHSVCDASKEVAVLLSGGEDARAVLAIVPRHVHRVCFTFADDYNREARIAERIARAVRAEWNLGRRPPDYYPRLFDDGCRLIGSQNEFLHLHAMGFRDECRLDRYDAVFGGLRSDIFLKGCRARTRDWAWHGLNYWPSSFCGETVPWPCVWERYGYVHQAVNQPLFDALADRLDAHRERVRAFRPTSAAEWTRLWPISQNSSTAYFQANRRLFRSYEPFMDTQLVKAAAAIPIEWKLNRRLFHAVMRPLWGRLGWIPHSQCHLPALGFWANVPVGFGVGAARQARRIFGGGSRGNQGPWGDPNETLKTDGFRQLVAGLQDAFSIVQDVFRVGYQSLFAHDGLTAGQQFKLLQVLWAIQEHSR